MAIKKYNRRLRIRRGIRKKVSGTAERPRLSVYKSNSSIYAQLIDDLNGNTLAYASSREVNPSKKNFNVEDANNVGKKIAELAKSNGIETVVFDRSGYRYHGRIKSLAEGAREGGLKF
ncbi:50S ribosomal protein L18 [Mangrovivirga cuniculi]|uniref:Large ribosomal subunit protein uL18 n=1 Tax=Mangrovivirga cuniculi TaxID=2715131 RepID=A0A4D7JG12_9BACT|nr:50S ribosomal protein L18 [Mangrovivirga cuniculi]QCK14043.1 50S ribosomal protein L18 [Mangrovivirga cuniculi]